MVAVDTPYPLEVIIQATPRSLQGQGAHVAAWKETVRHAGLARRNETYALGFLDERNVSVTIYYFPPDPMVGDVDNIVKPIMDGLRGSRLSRRSGCRASDCPEI